VVVLLAYVDRLRKACWSGDLQHQAAVREVILVEGVQGLSLHAMFGDRSVGM
jgi:hypothetical protein